MTIIRVQKDKNNPYVMVNKKYLNDVNLSFKAKGLLTYLLSKPDDWKVIIEHLKNTSKDGRDSVRKCIQELIDSGYIIREKQDKDMGKFTGYDYTVYENPTRETSNGKTVTEKPTTENPTLLINDNTNKLITNNDTNIKEKKEKPVKHKYGEYNHVLLTDDQYSKLTDKFGDIGVKNWIKKLDEGIELKAYKYKNHYLAILNWSRRDEENFNQNSASNKRNGEKIPDEEIAKKYSNNVEFL